MKNDILRVLLSKLAGSKTVLDSNKIYIYINPYLYLKHRKNPDFFKNVDVVFLDGFFLVFLFNLFKICDFKLKRYSFDMTSLAPLVFNDASISYKRIGIVGGNKYEIEKAVENLKSQFKCINIQFYHHGYFNFDLRNELIYNKVLECNVDILVVGMGTPKQEVILKELKGIGWSGTGYTCGAFISQSSVKLNYYPNFINNFQLRWLYRLIFDPIVRKKIFIIPLFVIFFICDFLYFKFYKL